MSDERDTNGRYLPGVQLGTRWTKAAGGNPPPVGRKKGHNVITMLAREHTALAIECLVEICQAADSDSARVAAAKALLDRGWGRAPLVIDIKGNAPSTLQVALVQAQQMAKDETAFDAMKTLAEKSANLPEPEQHDDDDED